MRKLPSLKDDFTRNVLTLLTGATIAQAIPVVVAPILARLYSPNDFGVLALFVAITGVLGTIANGRYEVAIMVVTNDEEAIDISAFGLLINTLFSIILFILILFLNTQIADLLGDRQLSLWLYFVPLVVWLIGFYNILTYLNLRKSQYNDLAKINVYKSTVMAFFQIVIGLIKTGVSGLIVGRIISSFVANFRLTKNVFLHYSVLKLNLRKSWTLAKKYKDFPLHNAPPGLVTTASLQMPFIFFPKLFSLTISGQFFLAQKMIDLPGALISKPISDVFFQTMVKKNKDGEVTLPFLFSTIRKLFLIIFPISIAIFILSPFLFKSIFGEEWIFSGIIAQYLAMVVFIKFIVSPVSPVFSITGFLKRGAIWKYSYFLSTGLLFFLSFYFSLDIESFLTVYVVHEYFLYLIYLYLIVKSTKEMDSRLNSYE